MADEITIKPANSGQQDTSKSSTVQQTQGANVTSASNATAGASTSNTASNNQETVTAANLNQPATPTNKRAYNLSADVDDASAQQKTPQKYAIPKIVWDKYPELVELIKQTESMDDDEREYWFQVLPIMTDHQIEKFKGILMTEKEQLSELDQEYEQELQKLNEKHMIEWKEFETKEKRKSIQTEEKKSEKEEASVEEELLSKLSQI